MIFSSLEFLLVFLPLCYAGFVLVHRIWGWPAVFPYLGIASLVFYAQWSLQIAAVLVVSAVANYLASKIIVARRESGKSTRAWLLASVAANIVALGYFKYTNFFLDTLNGITGTGFSHLDLILPIGISFYTFIQIGYLVEASNGQTNAPTLGRYFLFASFFPCVTAGPLVLQKEMFDQMGERDDPAFSPWRVSVGLTMFGMGLFKKIVMADTIAPFADAAFNGVAGGGAIAPLEAWVGSLCYSLQLYFDFSGYSDMAVGLGYLFGIKLPLNFNSPLKARSITDFWRRWHMTMTRFFTNYLYTTTAMKNTRKAIAGKYGPWRKFLATAAWPVIFTFLIAGIWHGAGWTFVIYGLLHGSALAVNHGWREFKMPKVSPVVGWFLTMLVVIIGLVIFRSPDLATSLTILSAMSGLSLMTGGGEATMVALDLPFALGLIVIYGAIVLSLPNTQEILRRNWISSDPRPEGENDLPSWLEWRPSRTWAVTAALVLVVAFTMLGSNTTFLYYQF